MMEQLVKEEPLLDLVPVLPPSVDVCHLKREDDGDSPAGHVKVELEHIAADLARCPMKVEPQDDSAEVAAGQNLDSEDPLKDLVPFLKFEVQSGIDMEQMSQDDKGNLAARRIKQEWQLTVADMVSRCPITAGPLHVSRQDEPEQPQEFRLTIPRSSLTEDCNPSREYSVVADISEHSSTQPPQETLGLWNERRFHLPSSSRDQLNVSQLMAKRQYPAFGTGTRMENVLVQMKCEDGFYSTECGSGTGRQLLTSHEDQGFVCNMCQNQFREKKLLKKHIKAHLSEDKYSEEICFKELSKSFHLAHRPSL